MQPKRTFPWLLPDCGQKLAPDEKISSAYSGTVCPVSVRINIRVIRVKRGGPQRFFELLELGADTRFATRAALRLSQAAFLGDGPRTEQMMVNKNIWCH